MNQMPSLPSSWTKEDQERFEDILCTIADRPNCTPIMFDSRQNHWVIIPGDKISIQRVKNGTRS